MIAYLKGRVIHARFGQIIVETAGVGYKISVNPQIDLPEDCVDTKCQVELFVHEHIREDCYDLYGFLTYGELEMFERLISVSGVGPKAGINIMAAADTKKIYSAIENSDLSFFTSISGIGKKVAAKIILELKSKLSNQDNYEIISGSDSSSDVLEAMATLGYKKTEIQNFLTKIPEDIVETEEKVRWLLKNLKK
ncbi:MAG: Holliday junction ATP-dependent DNA helicase RuvA [bacterium ADurb.Bin212]|nr:MAG: Holliday junction ATP-dependent DNA helicase RuvA [bacterium ADurb.Bin212]